jgi:alpha-galactosidase
MPIVADQHGWVLQTQRSAYALGVNKDGLLVHRYWGARLSSLSDYPAPPESGEWASFNGPAHLLPEEYPAWGGGSKYIEPCLKATFADGTRTVELRYHSATISDDDDSLTILMEDEPYGFQVALIYVIHHDDDLIERAVTLTNSGSDAVTVERAFSAQWHPPAGRDYRLTHLTGRWLDEWHIRRDKLPHGTTRLESRRIMTGHQHNPYFALDDGGATEETGEVYFGALAWSGSFAIAAEVTDFDTTRTRVSIGYNDWDFGYRLEGGQSLITPAAYAGWTDGGFGAASRILHDHIRERILPHGAISHKVLYNSWEATLFDVDEESQGKLAEIAADIGIELFVMDDGWFKGRNSDKAGLGDWTPDPIKFPRGLKPLIERVNVLGMDFGIWVEPEMINPDSDLYRAHPEWTIHFPSRERTTARNQLMLNLAREDVQAYLIERLDWLLREHKITFVKWDANRNVSEPGWSDATGDAREIWVRYVEGLYHVWGTLQERHPHVIFQSCSGGGGRADLGILHHADQVWVSDNTEATSRLAIQEGFSQLFPASIMEAWVTDAGKTPLDFRFAVSMAGALGVGANLLKWSASERETARKWITLYKDIRDVVQLGDQYRLLPVQGGSGYSAVQYMAKDGNEGVVFVFRTHLSEPATFPTLYLRGMIPDAQYTIEGIDGTRSGAGWMSAGIKIPIASEIIFLEGSMEYDIGDFKAAIRRIQRV